MRGTGRAGDAQAAFDVYGRDEVMRWLGAQPRRAVSSLTQMRERLGPMIQRAHDEPDYGLWPVSLRTGPTAGAVVGAVLLSRLPEDDREVEIGWHLNPDYWGNGYATEAGRGVAGLAFGVTPVGPENVELPAVPDRVEEDVVPGSPALDRAPLDRVPLGRAPLDRVIALVDPDNARSHAVCRRLGMTHVGQTEKYYGLLLELFELARADIVSQH